MIRNARLVIIFDLETSKAGFYIESLAVPLQYT